MTLNNLCQLFDTYYVAQHKSELNRRYVVSSELLFSDGTYDHHIDKEGYISVNNVENANYFIYIDPTGNLCLWIYELTPETLFKEIINAMNKIRQQTGMHKHSVEYNKNKKDTIPEELDKMSDDLIKNAPAEIININTFECTECNSNDFIKTRSGNVIILNCKKCRTKFKLIPSKYYIIKSKTLYTDLTNNGIRDYIEEVENDENQN